MKAWEIWSFQPEGWPEPHPAIIVSDPGRVERKPDVNVLICSSQPSTRQPLATEVILDKADGLDWPTLCKCDLLYLAKKDALKNRRGKVSPERRRAIINAINRSNDWV